MLVVCRLTASPHLSPGLKPCPMVLVFGCRQSRIDHIYKEETLFAKTQGVFRELYTAYSREPDKPKVLVGAGGVGGDSQHDTTSSWGSRTVSAGRAIQNQQKKVPNEALLLTHLLSTKGVQQGLHGRHWRQLGLPEHAGGGG